MKNCSFLSWFGHLLGVFLSLFSDLGFASVVKGGPGAAKVAQNRNTLKKGHQKGHIVNTNYELFAIFVSLIFGGISGSVFLRFGGRSVPNGGYLETLFQPCCSKAGKLETRVSCIPNTTFHGFEGLGSDVLGNTFSRPFLRWVWRGDFTIFWEIEGPAGCSKEGLLVSISSTSVASIFNEFSMENRIPSQAKDGGD